MADVFSFCDANAALIRLTTLLNLHVSLFKHSRPVVNY
jgi:hypothetical protein